MSIIFPNRASDLSERMDDPDCDRRQLFQTYAHFARVNRLFASWRTIYRHYLRPCLSRGANVLDIGFGGGDVMRNIAAWAAQDGLAINILGIDPDPRALAYARQTTLPPNIKIKNLTLDDVASSGQRFEVVISNHLLHHLQDQEIYALCKACEKVSKGLVLHNDIRRSGLAYLGFTVPALGFRKSFIMEDGLISIRRSFAPRELKTLVPENWEVQPLFPFRLLAMFKSKHLTQA